jgi:hypothetical protein
MAAASMVLLGVLSAASVFFTRWGPKVERSSVPAHSALSGAAE